MNKLMGNLAPYDYEPERAIPSSSEETESSENETSSNDTKLLVTNFQKTKTINWDKQGINIGVNMVDAKGKYEKFTVYAALRYQQSQK